MLCVYVQHTPLVCRDLILPNCKIISALCRATLYNPESQKMNMKLNPSSEATRSVVQKRRFLINWTCAFNVMISKIQWKQFWLASE